MEYSSLQFREVLIGSGYIGWKGVTVESKYNILDGINGCSQRVRNASFGEVCG